MDTFSTHIKFAFNHAGQQNPSFLYTSYIPYSYTENSR